MIQKEHFEFCRNFTYAAESQKYEENREKRLTRVRIELDLSQTVRQKSVLTQSQTGLSLVRRVPRNPRGTNKADVVLGRLREHERRGRCVPPARVPVRRRPATLPVGGEVAVPVGRLRRRRAPKDTIEEY